MRAMASRAQVENLPLSEREFYLGEFRGRTLGIALPEAGGEGVASVVSELVAGGARTLLLAAGREALGAVRPGAVVGAGRRRLEAEVWRALRVHGSAAIAVERGPGFPARCRDLAVRLGIFKLVWIDAGGGLRVRSGARQSFVHLEELRALVRGEGEGLEGSGRMDLWNEVVRMLEQGVPAVNVCSAEGLGEELFTYAGSGTLFTRERYMTVRHLGLDDFDAAAGLIRRGVEEGFLAPRRPEEVDEVLAAGFGAFVEGRDLAGIGALLMDDAERVAEIASLYTITRFLGEGVGNVLVGFAVEEARRRGAQRVFACTTSERVGAFFERHGFETVPSEALPASKWKRYDAERRTRLRCFQRDLAEADTAAGRAMRGGAGGGL